MSKDYDTILVSLRADKVSKDNKAQTKLDVQSNRSTRPLQTVYTMVSHPSDAGNGLLRSHAVRDATPYHASGAGDEMYSQVRTQF